MSCARIYQVSRGLEELWRDQVERVEADLFCSALDPFLVELDMFTDVRDCSSGGEDRIHLSRRE